MKLDMTPQQTIEISILSSGAFYIVALFPNSKKLNEITEIIGSEKNFEEMRQSIIVVLNELIKDDDCKRVQLENYIRVLSAGYKVQTPCWQLD